MNPFHYVVSAINGLFFKFRSRLKWSRRGYVEIPAGTIHRLTDPQQETIRGLKAKFQVCFEDEFNRINALENYHYLDLLNHALNDLSWQPNEGGNVLDVGSKNFFYASVLHRVFKPKKLDGVELDGHRVYQDFHSRSDYAQRYIWNLPNTNYHVMNFLDYRSEVDLVLCFFPFVFPKTPIAWGLSLRSFKPVRFFENIRRNMKKDGLFLMVNMGVEEYERACDLVDRVGLHRVGETVYNPALFSDRELCYVSIWRR